jgi:hypothetical protein
MSKVYIRCPHPKRKRLRRVFEQLCVDYYFVPSFKNGPFEKTPECRLYNEEEEEEQQLALSLQNPSVCAFLIKRF